ncbi:DUF6415 family natural product biosynthesis protein [Streptomyces sp. NPDC060028]|uniref:DUF6415 family natural product biosynthesis protein n=1 Tax=Streptomyces sp. NPDC060028 TaxID=3347041 RepID=UPI0036A667A3
MRLVHRPPGRPRPGGFTVTWEHMFGTSERAVLSVLRRCSRPGRRLRGHLMQLLAAVPESGSEPEALADPVAAVRSLLDVEVPGDYMGIRIHLRRMGLAGLRLLGFARAPGDRVRADWRVLVRNGEGMTVEHSRAAEPIVLPVRLPQQELKRLRLGEELAPTKADLFAAVGRGHLSATGAGKERIRTSEGEDQ